MVSYLKTVRVYMSSDFFNEVQNLQNNIYVTEWIMFSMNETVMSLVS